MCSWNKCISAIPFTTLSSMTEHRICQTSHQHSCAVIGWGCWVLFLWFLAIAAPFRKLYFEYIFNPTQWAKSKNNQCGNLYTLLSAGTILDVPYNSRSKGCRAYEVWEAKPFPFTLIWGLISFGSELLVQGLFLLAILLILYNFINLIKYFIILYC